MKMAKMQYSPEHIALAMTKERLGGTCLISICGAGETLVQPEVAEIAGLLVQEGHYVNITTNGTQTKQFDRLINLCKDAISRLHISFSLHYLELKRRGLLDQFFSNVEKMRKAGASILLQMNLCDAYIPYVDEIKKISKDRVGAYPQIALTRDESSTPYKVYSKDPENYISVGKSFNSPLFDFTLRNFNKKRNEFCYAGEWSGVLDLSTGILRKCYFSNEGVNIFSDLNAPVCLTPVGTECKTSYCVNSSHFMSLGVIPNVQTPSYGSLRNRPEAEWQTQEMKAFLSSRLYDSNKQYTSGEKMKLFLKAKVKKLRGWLSGFKFYRFLHNLKEKL